MNYSLIEKLQNIEVIEDFDFSKTSENLSEDEEFLAELLALENEDNKPIMTKKKQIQDSISTKNDENLINLSSLNNELETKKFDLTETLKNNDLVNFESTNFDLNIATKSLNKNLIKPSDNLQKNIMTNTNIKEKNDNILYNDQALLILQRRRAAYFKNLTIAKQADDRKNAIEFLNMVKQFDEAILAVKNCEKITLEDLEQIPPSPPFFKPNLKSKNLIEELEKRCNVYQDLVKKFNIEGQASRARMNERQLNQYLEAIHKLKKNQFVDVKTLPIPPGFEELSIEFISELKVLPNKENLSVTNEKKLKENSTQNTDKNFFEDVTQSNQLKLALFRQNEFKRAAFNAKSHGDINTAKIFLTKAKFFNQIIQTAKNGFSISIKEFPITPINLNNKVLPSDNKTFKLYSELMKQLHLSDEMRQQFQKNNDASTTLFYENLLKKCVQDLQIILNCDKTLPKFKIITKNCPVLDSNKNIPENSLDLKIILIKNLKLPDLSWKSSDCAIFVTYNFPFPHNAHQTGKTSIVKKTNEPEFNEIFRLSFNRNLQQKILRIVRRIPLKLEIYQKGSFLRSDRLLGHASVMLSELEQFSTLEKDVEIFDGRRPTNGTISLKIEISKPLKNINENNTTIMTKKWIELE